MDLKGIKEVFEKGTCYTNQMQINVKRLYTRIVSFAILVFLNCKGMTEFVH